MPDPSFAPQPSPGAAPQPAGARSRTATRAGLGGARNRATVAAEALLDGEAEALARKAVDLAMAAGDTTALRLCLERLVPLRRERTIHADLPPVASAADAALAAGRVVALVAAGQITPSEGQSLAGILDVHRRAIETEDLECRVAVLEGGAP